MIYRERVTIVGIGELPANVKVIAAGEVWRQGLGNELPDQQAITVTLPVWSGVDIVDQATPLGWRGREYTIRSQPVPIVALGRVDHYELMATEALWPSGDL